MLQGVCPHVSLHTNCLQIGRQEVAGVGWGAWHGGKEKWRFYETCLLLWFGLFTRGLILTHFHFKTIRSILKFANFEFL